MKNNTIGKVQVHNSKRSNSYKDKSSDLHITMDFGSVVPGKLERIYNNSSFRIGHRERVVLTSLVAPCFGRMQLKSIDYFVRMSDVWRNYAAMMAQEPVYRNGTSFVPQCMPRVKINELSLAVLVGAQLTVYKDNGSIGSSYADLLQVPANVPFNAAQGALPADMQTAISDLGLSWSFNGSGLVNALLIRSGLLLGSSSATSGFALSNPTPASLFDFRTQHPNEQQYGSAFVSLDGADYVVPVSVEYTSGSFRHYLLAFRLSSFGRRLRKVLIGCGWQFDLHNDDYFNLLRLQAFYTAYWYNYAPVLYQNFEETLCYRLQTYFDNESNPTHALWVGSGVDPVSGIIRDFLFNELANTFYTDEQDFVSSHTRSPSVSPSQSGLLSKIDLDVAGVPNIQDNNTPNEPNANVYSTHASIVNVVHGQLDSELLKRLYRQTNVNSIAGRRIAELLRAQGLGPYVDSCKGSYIGGFTLEIPVYDLPAQSDTYQKTGAQETGMRLGEYGAYGSVSKSHSQESFQTDEDGYYVNLITIVPVAGYCEAIDADAVATDKYDQPTNGEFDSLGYEMSPKYFVQGSQPWASMQGDATAGKLKDAFGMVPRYFRYKFSNNKINGDFSLRSTRKSYRGWFLDKLIEVAECQVDAPFTPSGMSDVARYVYQRTLNPVNVPIAGTVWRYPTRYEWISHFNRIFYNDRSDYDPSMYLDVSWSVAAYSFFALRDDNFVCHFVHEMPVEDSLLPVQDSFETTDDANHANGSLSKA